MARPRQQRAQRRYDRTWRRASPYLGAKGQPSPNVGLGESSFPGLEDRAYVFRDENGKRKIFTPDHLVRDLGIRYRVNRPKRKAIKRRTKGIANPERRSRVINRKFAHKQRKAKARKKLKRRISEGAKGNLLHEMAHVYQDKDVVKGKGIEGGADVFRRRVGREILGSGRNWGGYYPPEYAQEFIATYGADAWRRAQFGDHYGADPRTIDWLEADAAPSGERYSSRRMRKALRGLRGKSGRKATRRARRVLRKS